jgi:hypothetical protein
MGHGVIEANDHAVITQLLSFQARMTSAQQ